MNEDFYYAKGSSHLFCQDYAYAGKNKNGDSIAIISDGCSASKNSDIGARLLTTIAINNSSKTNDNSLLAYSCIYEANSVKNSLRLHETALDATLLIATCRKECLDIIATGDGIVFGLRKDGALEMWTIEYPTGCPYYLSYQINKQRKINYLETFGSEKKIFKNSYNPGIKKEELTMFIASHDEKSNDLFFRLNLDKKEYKLIGIASDGLLTFEDHFIKTMTALTDYKNYTGEFVKRRMKKHLKKCEKDNIGPSDDVSMAVIHLEE